MRMLLHQVRTDVRHQRLMLVAWGVLFAAQLSLNWIMPASREAWAFAYAGLLVLKIQLAGMIIIRCVHADSVCTDTAFWRTRPISQRTLFQAKTAFLALLVIAPLLVTDVADWLLMGFSADQILAAVVVSLLLALCGVFLTASLAAWTRSIASCLRQGAVLLIACVVWSRLAMEFSRGLPTRVVSGVAGPVDADLLPNRASSALLVALVVVGLCAIVAWVAAARLRNIRASRALVVVPLLLMAPILRFWPVDFMAVSRPQKVNPVVVADTGPRRALGPGEQRLAGPLRAVCVPSGHVVALVGMEGRIDVSYPGGAIEVSRSDAISDHRHPLRAWTNAANYKRVIQGLFPEDTLWFTDWHTPPVESVSLPLGLPQKAFQAGATICLEGTFTARIYAVVRRTSLPIRRTTVVMRPGQTVSIADVDKEVSGMTLTLVERFPRLVASSDLHDASLPVTRDRARNSRVFVLYHPGAGEATLLEAPPFMSAVSTAGASFHADVYSLHIPLPVLRYRLAGFSTDEWLRDARLCIIEGEERGTGRTAISIDDYDPHRPARRGGEAVGQDRQISSVSLPERPTEKEIGQYLDDLVAALPDVWRHPELRDIRAKFTVVGPEGVPLLLDRLPLGQRYENAVVRPVLEELTRPEHLPDLLTAMRRHVEVAWLFREKGWEDLAAQEVLTFLCRHHVPVSADALAVAARAAKPPHYPDLAWHLVHLQKGHEDAFASLERLPGFPLEAAVRRAWARARVDLAATDGLVGPAAEIGMPEALDAAIATLETGIPGKRRRKLLVHLRKAVGYDGPEDEFAGWLIRYRGHFAFDPRIDRFRAPRPAGK